MIIIIIIIIVVITNIFEQQIKENTSVKKSRVRFVVETITTTEEVDTTFETVESEEGGL